MTAHPSPVGKEEDSTGQLVHYVPDPDLAVNKGLNVDVWNEVKTRVLAEVEVRYAIALTEYVDINIAKAPDSAEEIRELRGGFSGGDVVEYCKNVYRSRKNDIKGRSGANKSKREERAAGERRAMRKKTRFQQLATVVDEYEKRFGHHPGRLLHPELMSDYESETEYRLKTTTEDGQTTWSLLDPEVGKQGGEDVEEKKVFKVTKPEYRSTKVGQSEDYHGNFF